MIYVINNDLKRSIKELKQEKNALILAHYYVAGDIQEIADFVGDSYYLSQIALEAKEQTIVFCGVHFMGESAKILSPSKTIIMPDDQADCPMAHMTSPEEIEAMRSKHDDLAVVCYINSTAETKALSDVCVTSSNAIKIVGNLKEKNIFFIPDKNLGGYVASQLPDKNIICNDGFCHVHNELTTDHVKKALLENPDAKVLTHPECPPDVLAISDFIGSTTAIIKYAAESDHKQFIICTEVGIFHELKRDYPDKQFYIAGKEQICPDMKKITLEKVYNSLISLKPEIHVDESISKKAKKALENMHHLA